jgi:hypothetical protein
VNNDLRQALIAAGWTPPPEEDPDLEAWRPALLVYRTLTEGPSVGSPMDAIDREAVDLLRAVVAAAPKPPSGVVYRDVDFTRGRPGTSQ